MPDTPVATCSRCGRTTPLRGDEVREWLWIESEGPARPVCLSCLDPAEREQHSEAVALMQEVERHIRRRHP